MRPWRLLAILCALLLAAWSVAAAQRPLLASLVAAGIGAALALGYAAGYLRGARTLPRVEEDIGRLATGTPLGAWDDRLSGAEQRVAGAFRRAFAELEETRRRGALSNDEAHFAGRKDALARLAAGIAGRFAQTLAGARTAVAAAERAATGDEPDAARCAADLALARHALDQAGALVAGLRRLAPANEPAPLAEALAESVERAVAPRRTRAERLHVALAVEVTQDAAALPVDATVVAGALGPLVDNALDALEGRGGRISVAARATEDGACIVVADDGPGPPADAARLFDPFFTTRSGSDGLGLGLVFARAAAARAAGSVTIARRPEGGTCATIEIARSGRPARST
jgi:two-component system C4-dicarboxylate transport sensor histidine kinase DctB